jgi:hypothetical protein
MSTGPVVTDGVIVEREGKRLLRLTSGEQCAADLRLQGYGVGEALTVTIESFKARRSAKANAYLWSTVYRYIAEHTGEKPEDIHDAMCEKFLPNERKRVEFYNKLTGEALQIETDGRRSSKLSGGPFYDFVEEVRLWAREFLQVETPDPDPEYWRKRAKAA